MLTLTLITFVLMAIVTIPILINIILILTALIVSLLFLQTFFSWFAIIIFLVYVSGIIVVFIYFSSLAPNQELNILYLTLRGGVVAVIMRTVVRNVAPAIKAVVWKLESIQVLTNNHQRLYLILAGFLLITLLAVVKLTTINKVPIRYIN